MSSDGRKAGSVRQRVVEQLFSTNKAKGLFAAIDGLECKTSSNLIPISAIEIRI